MSLDPAAIAEAARAHGPLVRVVVARVQGSAPREPGAALLVWRDKAAPGGWGQSGTIGGGALELEAAQTALAMLQTGAPARALTRALGPDLGQCCGGRVTLWLEPWDISAAERLRDAEPAAYARPLSPPTPDAQSGAPGLPGTPPLSARRLLAAARRGEIITPTLVPASARTSAPASTPALSHGWLVEPISQPRHAIWIWGAGHVGRALVQILAPLPDLALTWVDTSPDRFPEPIPKGVTPLPAAQPARLMPHAPQQAHHLILTYSHALDLALCDAALSHGFASAGLIGSHSKWARFTRRLSDAGHSSAQIARICCPIGQKPLGKHPQAIAVGVASALLTDLTARNLTSESKNRPEPAAAKGHRA